MAFSIDCGGIKDERLLYRTVSEEAGGHEGHCNKGGAGCGDDRFCPDRVSVSIRNYPAGPGGYSGCAHVPEVECGV